MYEVSGLSEYEDFTDELAIETSYATEETSKQPRAVNRPKQDDHEQESFVWVVFWSIIEFLIEVMFL